MSKKQSADVELDAGLNSSWSGLLAHLPLPALTDPDLAFRHLCGVGGPAEVVDMDASELASAIDPKPKPPNHLRLVCISDTHNGHTKIENLPPGDVLIHAGDFTELGHPREVENFVSWLGSDEVKEKYQHRLVVAGNHDLSFDSGSYARNWKRFGHAKQFETQRQVDKVRSVATYLNHEGVTIDGVSFFGSPFQPYFHDWAFNLRRKGQCRAMWDTLPKSASGHTTHRREENDVGGLDAARNSTQNEMRPVDVLITHGPPLGHGDKLLSGSHAGCIDLLDYVEAFPPKVHIFGHIHEGFGLTRNSKGTTFINASTTKVSYDSRKKLQNPPVVWDVPIATRNVLQ